MKTINLTQHAATKEQLEAGVIDLDQDLKERLVKAITFDELPEFRDLETAAFEVYDIAIEQAQRLGIEIETFGSVVTDHRPLEKVAVMIGGAPFFMSILHDTLEFGFVVRYAFSKRVVEEKVVDGEVVKTSRFVFEGFVEY